MSHYILVHGAWEGSWAWEFTAPYLTAKGHTVTTVDLPGSHGNPQEISKVTLASYTDTVAQALRDVDGKAILAGHSLAGTVISEAAEKLPEKVEKLIYVTAFLLKNGDNALAAMQRDTESKFLPAITFSDDQSYASASEETVRAFAFHDVEETRIQHSLPLMAPQQATAPFVAGITVTEENFGSIPKIYLRTTADKMISPAAQDQMIQNWNVDQVFDLDAGHFPTLSVPEKVARFMM